MYDYKRHNITEQEYDRIKKSLDQQKVEVRDIFGYRWVKCRKCGQAVHTDDCWIYGGIGTINVGECTNCTIQNIYKEHFYYDRNNSR